MEHNTSDSIGVVIKAARKSRNLTQEKLGELVDLGQRHIASIENEEKRPSLDKLFEIIRVLGIDANLIFYPENPLSEDTPAGRLARLLSQCSERELRVITALVETYLSERE
jgi:transcriptional regulator with XRE-family HTH domain